MRMKVHLRADEATKQHTKFTVFMNEKNCGQLCMSEEEAIFFHDTFMFSQYKTSEDSFVSSGVWWVPKEEGIR